MGARTTTRAGSGPAALVAVALGLLVPIATALLVGSAEPAAAACAPRLSVSRTAGLAPGGETLTVSGSCYDVNKGVYVAFCVVPPAGAVPSPCGGGVDMSGAGGLSHWISSNPPPQGVGLTTPYGPGGSFTVTMRPTVALNATVDCRRVSCAVVTRNDHTRSTDRSQDVIVPVSFAADPQPAPTTTAPAPVFVPPPTEAPTTTTAPESTTTTAPPEETTLVPDGASGSSDGVEEARADELAAEPASAQGTSSGGSAGVVVGLVVAVLVVGGVGGWLALRRRPSAALVADDAPVGFDGSDGRGGPS